MDEDFKLVIGVVTTVLFGIPFAIFLFCGWWHIGELAYDVIFNDKEATTTNMFQLCYLSFFTVALSSAGIIKKSGKN